MRDLGLNENFSVHLDGKKDLTVVGGADAIEQEVVVHLTDRQQESVLSSAGTDTVEQRIELVVNRVLSELSYLEQVKDLEISRKVDSQDVFEVEITYGTDDTISTEVVT